MPEISDFESRVLGLAAQELLTELGRANGFTPEDLAHNRAGRIADKQMWRLSFQAVKPLYYAGGAFLGWLIVVFVIRLLAPASQTHLAGGFQSVPVVVGYITIGGAAVFLAALIKCVYTSYGLMVDLALGSLSTIVGRLEATEEPGPVYRYRLGEDNFEVSQAAHKALEPRRNYRAYFTRRSRVLLSVEPV